MLHMDVHTDTGKCTVRQTYRQARSAEMHH